VNLCDAAQHNSLSDKFNLIETLDDELCRKITGISFNIFDR
jgi:hypothetical protein